MGRVRRAPRAGKSTIQTSALRMREEDGSPVKPAFRLPIAELWRESNTDQVWSSQAVRMPTAVQQPPTARSFPPWPQCWHLPRLHSLGWEALHGSQEACTCSRVSSLQTIWCTTQWFNEPFWGPRYNAVIQIQAALLWQHTSDLKSLG